MRDFTINKCRLCEKIFCCVNCRKKHEEIKHNIFPDCNFCMNQTIRISNISDNLLMHLKTNHWPIHCILCQKVFSRSEEIIEHLKCPINVNSEKNTYTPPFKISEDEAQYDSPPLIPLFQKNQPSLQKVDGVLLNLATSTPMQKCQEDNNLLQKIKTIIITPVNSAENTKDSILKKGGNNDNSKRRVTFSDNILTDASSQDENRNQHPLVLATPIINYKTEAFHSIQETEDMVTNDRKILSNTPRIPASKKVSIFKLDREKIIEEPESINNVQVDDNTIWISATSISTTEEESVIDFQSNISIKEQTEKIEENDHLSLQIYFTPNSSFKTTEFLNPQHNDLNTYLKKQDLLSSRNSADTQDMGEIESQMSLQNKLWSSVNKFVKNVSSALHDYNGGDSDEVTSKSFKRSLNASLSEDEPKPKKIKLIDIQCRRTIRELPSKNSNDIYINIINNVINNVDDILESKIFVDKSTQTDN